MQQSQPPSKRGAASECHLGSVSFSLIGHRPWPRGISGPCFFLRSAFAGVLRARLAMVAEENLFARHVFRSCVGALAPVGSLRVWSCRFLWVWVRRVCSGLCVLFARFYAHRRRAGEIAWGLPVLFWVTGGIVHLLREFLWVFPAAVMRLPCVGGNRPSLGARLGGRPCSFGFGASCSLAVFLSLPGLSSQNRESKASSDWASSQVWRRTSQGANGNWRSGEKNRTSRKPGSLSDVIALGDYQPAAAAVLGARVVVGWSVLPLMRATARCTRQHPATSKHEPLIPAGDSEAIRAGVLCLPDWPNSNGSTRRATRRASAASGTAHWTGVAPLRLSEVCGRFKWLHMWLLD